MVSDVEQVVGRCCGVQQLQRRFSIEGLARAHQQQRAPLRICSIGVVAGHLLHLLRLVLLLQVADPHLLENVVHKLLLMLLVQAPERLKGSTGSENDLRRPSWMVLDEVSNVVHTAVKSDPDAVLGVVVLLHFVHADFSQPLLETIRVGRRRLLTLHQLWPPLSSKHPRRCHSRSRSRPQQHCRPAQSPPLRSCRAAGRTAGHPSR
mmetsp:Transcript_10844/g.33255  ORF Transcript_10844/g.33255 Transcript_10844/m.33255 type:complete len:206 (-) Transcript_10844:108-725(-)